jgi:hypothetical protein
LCHELLNKIGPLVYPKLDRACRLL